MSRIYAKGNLPAKQTLECSAQVFLRFGKNKTQKEFECVSFYHVRREQIDFIGADDRLDKKSWRYFEVKFRDSLDSREFKFLFRTAQKNQSEFRIISKNKLASEKNYSIVPIWLLK